MACIQPSDSKDVACSLEDLHWVLKQYAGDINLGWHESCRSWLGLRLSEQHLLVLQQAEKSKSKSFA